MVASVDPVSWGHFTQGFLDALASRLQGERVLEVFAGNGALAAALAARGTDITATSLFAGHDGHERGMHHPVIEMEAADAVRRLGPAASVLLMSWPTATDAAAACAILWGPERDILFVGEVTDYGQGHLGGCASDLFFEVTDRKSRLEHYEPTNMLEQALVLRTKPGLDTALLPAYRGSGQQGPRIQVIPGSACRIPP